MPGENRYWTPVNAKNTDAKKLSARFCLALLNYTNMRDGETYFFCPAVTSVFFLFLPEVQFVKLRFTGGPTQRQGGTSCAAQDSCRKLSKIKCMKRNGRPSSTLFLTHTLSPSLCPSSRCAKICHSTRVTGRNLTFLWASEEFPIQVVQIGRDLSFLPSYL